MENFPVEMVTWAVEWGCVHDKELDKPFKWFVDKQIVPMDIRLKKLYRSRDYSNYVKSNINKFNFEFNEDLYKNCKLNKSKKEMENII